MSARVKLRDDINEAPAPRPPVVVGHVMGKLTKLKGALMSAHPKTAKLANPFPKETKDINATFERARVAEGKAENLRITAGQMLLELQG